MGVGPVNDDGIDAEIHFAKAGSRNPDVYVRTPECVVVGLGELDFVEFDVPADLGGQDAFQVTRDEQVRPEIPVEVLVVDEIVQVGLYGRKRKFVYIYFGVEALGLHVE